MISKKTLYILPTLLLPVVASAKIPNPLGGVNDLSQVVAAVVDIVQILLIMATVLYLLYAGLMFVTARGEPSKISKARDALLWGMVGAALILAARVLVVTLQSTVGNILS
jgi:uncharacterized BrkB/YihY/UPF0761 family membrane protein